MSDFDFDPTEAEPSRGSFVCIPAGPYLQRLVSMDEETKDTGVMQRVAAWECVDGEYAGSTILQFVITHHKNEMTQKIGRETLSAICNALTPGVAISNSDQLLGKVCVNTVQFIPSGTVEKGRNGRADYTHTKDTNRVTKHEAAAGAGAATPPTRRPAATPPPATTPASFQETSRYPSAASPPPVNGATVPSWRTARA